MHVTVRDRLVVSESGVGELLGAALRRAFDDRAAPRIIPRLRAGGTHHHHQNEQYARGEQPSARHGELTHE